MARELGIIDRLLRGESRKINLCTPSFGVFEVSVSSGELGIPHTNHGPMKQVNQFIARLHKADEARITHSGTSSLNAIIGQYLRHKHLHPAIASNSHRSIIYAACINGFEATYLPVHYDAPFETIIPPSPDEVRSHLEDNPETGAVILTSPTYEGVYAKAESIARICHKHGALCILDSAWDHLPHRMPLDVDIMVKSTHKMEGANQGGAIILWRDKRLDANLMHECYALELSTSPSVETFRSVENAYRTHVARPRETLGIVSELAKELKKSLQAVEGIELLTEEYLKERWDRHVQHLDPWKMQIAFTDYRCTGYQVNAEMESFKRVFSGIIPEKSGPRTMLLISTLRAARLCDTRETEEGGYFSSRNSNYCMARAPNKCSCEGVTEEVRVVLEKVLSSKARGPNPHLLTPQFINQSPLVVRPMDALYGKRERVRLDKAEGRICADIIVPYPPGYPCIVPGQRITKDVIDFLLRLQRLGGEIMAADADFRKITVMKELRY